MTSPILDSLEPERVLQLAQEMIRIPSFCKEEKTVADWAAVTMGAMGFDEVWQQEVTPGRPNVFGRLRGTGTGPSVLLNGHLDHNMVCDGWTRDPFGGEIHDGWLYGLGAANMKAGDAAMLAAMEAVRKSGVRPKGDLTIAFVVGELEGGLGTRAALADGLRADMFLLAEPTELGIVTMHAGVVQVRITVHGQMRHYTTRAGHKIHAIEKAMRIAQALGPSYETIPQGSWMTFTPKPQYDGLPRLNLGVIRGGMTPAVLTWRSSLIPDYCEMIYDLRIVPGQSPQTVMDDIGRLLERLRGEDPDLRVDTELVKEHIYFPPFEVPLESPVVNAMAQAHREIVGSEPLVGALAPTKYAGADSAHMLAAGIPGVMYGPAGKFLSVPDERVELENVVKASRVFALAISRVWGVA
ncbi:MAG: M20 family metallopeptidase [bacterium]